MMSDDQSMAGNILQLLNLPDDQIGQRLVKFPNCWICQMISQRLVKFLNGWICPMISQRPIKLSNPQNRWMSQLLLTSSTIAVSSVPSVSDCGRWCIVKYNKSFYPSSILESSAVSLFSAGLLALFRGLSFCSASNYLILQSCETEAEVDS